MKARIQAAVPVKLSLVEPVQMNKLTDKHKFNRNTFNGSKFWMWRWTSVDVQVCELQRRKGVDFRRVNVRLKPPGSSGEPL